MAPAVCGNVNLCDLCLDVMQIELNAAALNDSYQQPCFLLTGDIYMHEAPFMTTSSLLWHRNVKLEQKEIFYKVLYPCKRPNAVGKTLPLKMHCGQYTVMLCRENSFHH